jgi:hypothetical protein
MLGPRNGRRILANPLYSCTALVGDGPSGNDNGGRQILLMSTCVPNDE